MSDIKLDLDISSLTQYLDNFAKEIVKDVATGIGRLAEDTHTHIMEETNKLSKYDREKYQKNLSQAKLVDTFMWEIVLEEPAITIEEGKPRDMKGEPGQWGLLKNAETSKDGRHYKIIPLDMGMAPKEIGNTYSAGKAPFQKGLAALVKQEMIRLNMPYKKLEMESAVGRKTGNVISRPKLGSLHEFSIKSGLYPGTANTDVLSRVNVYQKFNEQKNKVERHITTFRTVVEGQDGKWQYPAPQIHGFMEEAAKWAAGQWNNSIMPQIIEKYRGK